MNEQNSSNRFRASVPAGASAGGTETPGDASHSSEHRAHKFLLSWRTMDGQLRSLTGAVLAEVIAAGILFGAKDFLYRFFPHQITIPDGNGSITIMSLTYYAAVFIVLGGLYLLTRGAFEATRKGRLLFAGVLAVYFLIYLGLFIAADLATALLSLMFKTFLYCGLAGWLLQAYRGLERPDWRNILAVVAILGLGVVPVVKSVFFSSPTFLNYLILLGYPLPIVFLLAGTDWAEIFDAIAQWIAPSSAATAPAGWLAALGVLVCVGFAAWMTIASDGAGWRYVPAAAGAAFFVAIILQLAGQSESWATEFAWSGLVMLTGAFMLLIGMERQRQLVETGRMGPVSWLWPACFALVSAALLIAAVRTGKLAALRPVLLFGVILGAFWAVTQGSEELDATLHGALLGIAVMSLAGIGALLWMQSKGRDVRAPLRYTILLNIGCMALYGLAILIDKGLHVSDEWRLMETVLIFGAILSDIVISGHSITNEEGKLFPRRSRLYLFFGYVLLVTATVVFWDSARASDPMLQTAVKILMSPEGWLRQGVIAFGPATLLTLFAVRLRGSLAMHRAR